MCSGAEPEPTGAVVFVAEAGADSSYLYLSVDHQEALKARGDDIRCSYGSLQFSSSLGSSSWNLQRSVPTVLQSSLELVHTF